MLTMRISFFTIVNAVMFMLLGLLAGLASIQGWAVVIAGVELPEAELLAICGLSFVMAYSALCLTR